MLIFDEKLPINGIREWDSLAETLGKDKVIQFDLETTGLSPKTSFIYIIGINYYQNDEWHILQLFNDDGKSEPEMIRYFMELCKGKTTLFHFNGDTFDIPFVRTLMEQIRMRLRDDIPNEMDLLTSVDLLKEIRPFKYALGLPNVKQKTVEQYLGIHREDKYNGGQLIDVYLSYLSSGSQRNRDLVLLHNRDDMEGMYHLARMHALSTLCSGEFKITGMEMNSKNTSLYLNLTLELRHALPCRLVTTGNGVALNGCDCGCSLELPVTECDAECTITKERKHGFFLPQSDYEGRPCFRDPDQRKKLLVTADDALLGNEDALHAYSVCVIQNVMKKRPRSI